jgi:hypothetical protein
MDKQVEIADARTERMAERDQARFSQMQRKKSVQELTKKHEVRFFYYRPQHVVGIAPFGATVHEPNPRGGVCIAAKILRLADGCGIRAAASVCSPTDQFNYLKAREVAIGRLLGKDANDTFGVCKFRISTGTLDWVKDNELIARFLDIVCASAISRCSRKNADWYIRNMLEGE